MEDHDTLMILGSTREGPGGATSALMGLSWPGNRANYGQLYAIMGIMRGP